MNYHIIDSKGFLTPEIDKAAFSQVKSTYTTSMSRPISETYCSTASIKDGSCYAYIWFSTISGGSTVTVSRSYKGWLETFGDIGGIKEVVLILSSLLYCFFHDRAVQDYMVW